MDVDRVRRLVVESLPELGFPKAQPNWETLLMHEGRPTGWRFEFDQLRAYWFAERESVEFYRDDWVPLRKQVGGRRPEVRAE